VSTFSISKSPGIYIIKNKKNGNFYLGQSGNLRRRWQSHHQRLIKGIHSNPHLQAAWNKYGESAFEFLVLEYCAIEQLDEREQRYLTSHVEKGNCYNIAKDATAPMRGKTHTPEARQKIAEAGRGRVFSDETRQKMSNSLKGKNLGRKPPNTGKPLSDEQKRHLSIVLTGHHHTPETCAKMSETRRGEGNHFFGKKHSEETRQKMSEARKGKSTITDEGRKKISEAHIGNKHNLGRKSTPETRKKLSDAKIGKPKSADTRARMKAAQIKRRLENPMSNETRAKMTEANRRNAEKRRLAKEDLKFDSLSEGPCI
jgi:group I intron endonuclease